MKYGKARELVESAIELLAEADNKYNSMEHDKPSTNRLEKPAKPVAKPSAQGRATNSPVVKFGKRTTSRRYVTRSNRWALRQIAKNKSAVSEAIDQLDEAVNAKDLRKKIDLHGNQVKVHSQLYNRTMDISHRDQAYAHSDAHKKAVKKYKKLTGKEYYGKPSKSSNPVYLKTTAANRTQQSNAAGQPGGMNW